MSQVVDIANAFDGFAITPSDVNKIAEGRRPCPLYVGVQGNLRVLTAGGTDLTFQGVQGFFPVHVEQVFETGTTAQGIIGLI